MASPLLAGLHQNHLTNSQIKNSNPNLIPCVIVLPVYHATVPLVQLRLRSDFAAAEFDRLNKADTRIVMFCTAKHMAEFSWQKYNQSLGPKLMQSQVI